MAGALDLSTCSLEHKGQSSCYNGQLNFHCVFFLFFIFLFFVEDFPSCFQDHIMGVCLVMSMRPSWSWMTRLFQVPLQRRWVRVLAETTCRKGVCSRYWCVGVIASGWIGSPTPSKWNVDTDWFSLQSSCIYLKYTYFWVISSVLNKNKK